MADAARRPARRKPLGDVEVRSEATPAADGQQTPDEEAIRARAYELYLERGDRPGGEVEDWLEAEQEVRGRQP